LVLKSGIGIGSNVKSKKVGIYRDAVPVVHGFRKFAITQMARAKVDKEIAKNAATTNYYNSSYNDFI
jgi:hypothetical protein